MDTNVLGPAGFCCRYCQVCRGSVRSGDRFYEGQLSYVGRQYDLTLDGKALRVVVVGQEYGLSSPLVSLDHRYAMIYDGSGMSCRYYREGDHPARNPHMRGTTSALRILFGRGIGSDWNDEFVASADGERFHIFDAFALVNVLLCAAGPPNSSTGRSTRTMRRNCLEHFAATLKILEPTLVVLQGNGVQRWIAPLLDQESEISPRLARTSIAGLPLLLCRFSHPSARGRLRWGDRLDAPYLTGVVEPTLRRAIEAL